MVALHALELALDYHADVRRQVLVERLAVALQRHVLTPLAFVEDGLVILAGDHRFQIDPAPMQIAGHARTCFRITTEGANQLLQFGRCAGAVLGALHHGGLEVGTLEVFGAFAEALLAVFAGFDQVVEYRNRFFRVHFRSPAQSLLWPRLCASLPFKSTAQPERRFSRPAGWNPCPVRSRSAHGRWHVPDREPSDPRPPLSGGAPGPC